MKAQLLLGTISRAMGDYERAVEAYRSALERHGDNQEVHLGLASSQRALGNQEEALRHWERWMQLVEGDPTYAAEADRVAQWLKVRRVVGSATDWIKGLLDSGE